METMKTKFSVTAILAILTVFTNVVSAQRYPFKSTSYQETLKELMLEKHVPALGIGIIEDGVLRQVRVYGDLKFNTPAPYNAIFNVASLTKPITTLLVLRLVSNGDWDLDEPLDHYWVDPDVQDDPLHKELTTRHVLTHQTGFDNWRRMHETKKLTFNFKPGTKVNYSGEGFEYLRHAIENKFDTSIEELAYSVVFQPYGMNDTWLLWDDLLHESRYAEEHNKEGIPYNLVKRTVNACASDDVLTTIEDYCLFSIHTMKGTGLSKEVHEDMLRLQAISKPNEGFGLGWYIKQNFNNGEDALMHTGSDAGVATKVILFPDSKRGIVIFTNGDHGFDIIEKVETEYLSSGS